MSWTAGTARMTLHALDQFERLVAPKRIGAVSSRTMADFISKRRCEPAHKHTLDEGEGHTVSPATVNKELRHLRVVLRRAVRWNYLAKIPEIDFLKEFQRLPTYISPEDFAAVYQAADQAKLPADQPYPAAD